MSACKERLVSYLTENGVDFEALSHPVVYTAQEVAAVQHVSGKEIAKVVIALADGSLIMLVLPGSYKVNVGKAAAALGAREMRLAHEDEFAATFPDCEVGAMPPFGNLYNVPILVDGALAEDEKIVFQAGTHADTLVISYADYEKLVTPRVGDFAIAP